MAQSSGSTLTDRVRRLGWSALRSTLDVMYPPDCPICETSIDRDMPPSPRFVCADCLARIDRFEPPWCETCGVPTQDGIDLCSRCGHASVPFDKARAVGPYDGVLARLIQLYKFQGERALARDLSRLLTERVVDEGMDEATDAVTFVPMTRRALRDRGFNHVERLARDVGDAIGRPVIPALEKTRETRPQVELPERERLTNLRGAFARNQALPWNSLLLIDDVFTTGVTLGECSRALMDGGVERVVVATLARTAEDA